MNSRNHAHRLFYLFVLLYSLILSTSDVNAERVNISHSAVSGSQAVLFVTRDAGFFKKYDLEPQIVFVAGAPPNIAALVSGDLDLTILPDPPRSPPISRAPTRSC